MSRESDYRRKLLEDLKKQGYSPYQAEKVSDEQIAKAKLGSTAMENVVDDQQALGMQQDAAQRYKEMADNGGYTQADRTANLRAQKQASSADAARRKSILQGMQQRGMAGSGAELAAQLSSADSAAEQNAEASQEIAARGEAKRDAAIAARGQLGGQMRNQAYQRDSNLAQARDGVSRFNADLAARQTFQNNQSTNQAARDNNQGKNQFDQTTFGYDYNGSVDEENRRLLQEEAKKRKRAGMAGAVLGAAGAGAGAYFGGPIGATAGYQVGNSIGQNMAHGGKVKGPEIVEGDDEANDIIPVRVSAGEIILPKSKTNPIDAAKFVAEQCNEEEDDDDMDLETALKTIAAALTNLDKKK